MTAPTLADLAATLAVHVDAARYERDGDPAGVWIASDRPVRRLGLRLEAGPAPYAWLRDAPGSGPGHAVDALLVHRPFGLWPARLPDGVGVLAVHRALDDLVWTGGALARALGMTPDADPLRRDGEPVGLVGPVGDEDAFEERLETLLGGVEAEAGEPLENLVGRVAVVGAMTEALVLEASSRGAAFYVTGQMRSPAAAAVRQTAMRVVAVGQARSERWGLRLLAARLAEAWPGLEVVDLDQENDAEAGPAV